LLFRPYESGADPDIIRAATNPLVERLVFVAKLDIRRSLSSSTLRRPAPPLTRATAPLPPIGICPSRSADFCTCY